MNKKRIVGVALAVGACGVLAAAGMMLSKKSGAVVLDQAGNEIAKLILQDGKISYECEDKYQSYADIVSQEAVKMIQEREGVNEKTAAKILADREITVKTWLDRETLDAVIGSYNDGEGMACERFGAAVTDKEGHLTACYSDTKGNDNYNNVTKPAFAGSTMKPLSVYGLAIEDGTICWSSLYEDSAYGVVAGDNGIAREWPGNVCAVWYKSDKDMDAETADAARICKGVFEKIGADASEQYSIPTGVKEEVYCKKSGLLAGEQCQETGIGYYKEGTFSKLCEECR